MPKFTEVPVVYNSVRYDQQFIAQIKKPGSYQDGKCYTGSFVPNTNIFRIDTSVRFYLTEIGKLWLINDYEFPQFVNFGDSITSGVFRFTSPELKKTPLRYYIVSNQRHNAFLSLYLVVPTKVLKAVAASGITFEGYKVCPEWGKPLVSENQYRYDLVVNVPIRAESKIPSVNVSDACSKLILQAERCFSQVDGYLQLLDNVKPIPLYEQIISTVEITYRNNLSLCGVFLDGRCHFQVVPAKQSRGVTSDFVVYQEGVSVSSQTSWFVELFLPVDSDDYLEKELQHESNMLLGERLGPLWGNPVIIHHGVTHTCRKRSMFFYHQEEGYKKAFTDYLYQIERLLRKCPETKMGGYRSIIHLKDF